MAPLPKCSADKLECSQRFHEKLTPNSIHITSVIKTRQSGNVLSYRSKTPKFVYQCAAIDVFSLVRATFCILATCEPIHQSLHQHHLHCYS